MPAFLIPILATMAVWNILTDWTWIGNILGVMPEEDKKDINSRAISITKLLDNAKSIVYSAQKDKRNVSQQEKELIQKNGNLARQELNDMAKKYKKKFVLFGKQNVLDDLERTRQNILLQIENMEQIASITPRKPITQEVLTGICVTVIDGDTIAIQPTGLVGPKIEQIVRLVGIDAPESTTIEGEASKKYLTERIAGKYIKIESDPTALIDMYGRRLGVIYEGAENINVWMLKNGYAEFYEFEPNALVFAKQWKAASDEGKKIKKAYSKNVSITAPTTAKKAQIFTGILTQGSLGETLPDSTREADIIDTQDALEEAARNNLIAFLISLPGAIRYEIAFKNRVITKDGYERISQRIQVIVGYDKNGNPKYKTYTNKFAVLSLFFWTETLKKVKLKELNLGPVNATTFFPKPDELKDLSDNLQKTISAENINQINEIKTSKTTIKVSPPQPVAIEAAKPRTFLLDDTITIPEVTPTMAPAAVEIILPETKQNERLYKDDTTGRIVAIPPAEVSHRENIQRTTFTPYTPPTPPTPETPAKIEVKLPYSNNPNRCSALTIAEFFDVKKINYPKLAERAPIYEAWGLGPAATYIGTAEQNNKWLREAKKSIGCKI